MPKKTPDTIKATLATAEKLIQKKAKKVRKTARKLTRHADRTLGNVRKSVRNTAEDAWEQTGEVTDELVNVGKRTAQSVTQQLKEEPLLALAVAAGIIWLARRHLRNRNRAS